MIVIPRKRGVLVITSSLFYLTPVVCIAGLVYSILLQCYGTIVSAGPSSFSFVCVKEPFDALSFHTRPDRGVYRQYKHRFFSSCSICVWSFFFTRC